MIPRAAITQWRHHAPWPGADQVEHDLILSRALCELYQHPTIQQQMAFRGGTALHKLFASPQSRFSEDLDFVQISAAPIGELVHAIRACLDVWLGQPTWKQNQSRFTLTYTFLTEMEPIVKRKLKIEINTREHFTTNGYIQIPFTIDSFWFSGHAHITTYSLEELIGTKLRALYQRKKGRDLYDLWFVLKEHSDLNLDIVINAYKIYMAAANTSASRAEFEKNLSQKKHDKSFRKDITALLSVNSKRTYDFDEAFELVQDIIIDQLPGESWRGKR